MTNFSKKMRILSCFLIAIFLTTSCGIYKPVDARKVPVHGDKRASKINFPTANIIPKKLIKPKKGVYAIKARYLNNFYNGIANFGIRPTIEGKKLLLEAHLFEFNQNIYSKDLTVEFLTFIREEKKFNDFASLSKKIQKDIQIIKKYHLEK